MIGCVSSRQGGAALVVSLIMLVLVTLLVITALNVGSSNFQAVTNTQFRDRAIAAANAAIQTRIGSDFLAAGEEETFSIDLDNDGPTGNLNVQVTPACISATVAETADPSSLSLPPELSLAATWNTVWDIQAVVTDPATGASAVVHTGIRVLLSQPDRDDACPGI